MSNDESRSPAGSSARDGHIALRAAAEMHRRPSLSHVIRRRGLGPYRGYGEVLDALDRLADAGARIDRVGRSVRGEPLFSVSLGELRPTGKTRTTVLMSGVHPIEWIGIETHMALLERLARTDLDGRSVVAFPVVNPDGLLKVENNLRAGRRRFARHNVRGVDLNRNFDARWDRPGLAQRLLPWIFGRGSRAASEPEVEAISHALSGRRVDRALSLHSFGGAVLYPRAYSRWPVADTAEHRAWARRIARAADERPYRAVSCAWFGMGLTHSGLELDWLHDRHGAISLLIECSRGGFSLRPSRLFEPFAWYNPPDVDETAGRIAEAALAFASGQRV